MPERRNFPRVGVQIPVSCSPLNVRTVTPPFDGTTRDLSAGGLGLEIPNGSATGPSLLRGATSSSGSACPRPRRPSRSPAESSGSGADRVAASESSS
ncbi:MAG: PilZ domain-containing protein [Deltaproteobacteria bacterium]|nr:PilZ domain-containing protein [Deltaproteobacteria bacterium]